MVTQHLVNSDEFINRTYNELLGRDAGEEGLTYWGGDLAGGASEESVISNIKLSDEYLPIEKKFKNLASSMEGKTYEPLVKEMLVHHLEILTKVP